MTKHKYVMSIISFGLFYCLNYIYATSHFSLDFINITEFSFSDFIRFCFLDSSYTKEIEIESFNLVRMSLFLLFLIGLLREILHLISDAKNYHSMTLHRYKGVKQYALKSLNRYNEFMIPILGIGLVVSLIVYGCLSVTFNYALNFTGIFDFVFYLVRIYSLYLMIFFIIELFDILSISQIAYISICLMIAFDVIIESQISFHLLTISNRNFVILITLALIGIILYVFNFIIKKEDVL